MCLQIQLVPLHRGRWITGASTRSSALEMSTEEPGVIVASPDGGAASDADAALSAATAAVVGPVVGLSLTTGCQRGYMELHINTG